jgi:hypothetical protein
MLAHMPLFGVTDRQLGRYRSAKNELAEEYLRPVPNLSALAALIPIASPKPEQNVVGVGIGEKISRDIATGILSIKLFVRIKYPDDQISDADRLPATINGLPVDVEETGTFVRFAKAAAMPDPRTRFRPAQPGCSVGFEDPHHQFRMAGTLGAIVKQATRLFLLSNNHVLADENQLAVGSAIFQPALLDGGDVAKDRIASLTRFVTLTSSKPNKVDCAIAQADKNSLVSNEVLYIGAPSGVADAAIDMQVHKFGRTTGYRVGRVTSVETDVTIGYEMGNLQFDNQIVIVGRSGQPFSAAGDSGSLILERGTNRAIGLLFGGSTSHTIANHIGDVLRALKVTLA